MSEEPNYVKGTMMKNPHRISRVATLAVGLGVGSAMGSMPAIASADSIGGADIAAYLPDFGAVAAAAAVVTPPVLPDDFSNYAISAYGIPLYQAGTAQAQSTFGNIAIAHGDHAAANAYSSGFFNFASADGDNSVASDGVNSGWFNTATAEGEHATAGTGGFLGSGSFNTATASGFGASAYAGYATSTVGGSNNTATAEGTLALANAGGDGSSNNVANAIGDHVISYVPSTGAAASTDLLSDGAAAAASVTPATLPDDYSNFAVSISGLQLISIGHASASSSFGNIAIAQGEFSDANAMSGFFNYATADGDHSLAVVGDTGSFNYASAVGDHSSAIAAWGSGNTATANGDYAVADAGQTVVPGVYDSNFNTATAEGFHAIAYAGWDGSSNNVATATGDYVQVYDPSGGPFTAAATDNWLTGVVSSLGAGSAAGDSGNWFTDLLSSFDGGSAAAESGNWLSELLSSFDGGSAAADGANFWTELSTLF
jgi:hypothetical protein